MFGMVSFTIAYIVTETTTLTPTSLFETIARYVVETVPQSPFLVHSGISYHLQVSNVSPALDPTLNSHADSQTHDDFNTAGQADLTVCWLLSPSSRSSSSPSPSPTPAAIHGSHARPESRLVPPPRVPLPLGLRAAGLHGFCHLVVQSAPRNKSCMDWLWRLVGLEPPEDRSLLWW
jgi:hypothetical protein